MRCSEASTWRRQSPWPGRRMHVGGGHSPPGHSPSAGAAQAPRHGPARIPAPPPPLALCAPTRTPAGSRTEASRRACSPQIGIRKMNRIRKRKHKSLFGCNFVDSFF